MLWTGPGLCQAGAMRPPEGGQAGSSHVPSARPPASGAQFIGIVWLPSAAQDPRERLADTVTPWTHAALCGRPRLHPWDTWTASLEVGIWPHSLVGTQPIWKARWDT